MGFFTSTSKGIVNLFTFVFSIIGLLLLAFGLYMRIKSSQWAAMQAVDNGASAVYTYIGLGASMFVLSLLGRRGTGTGNRFSLFVFQIGTLACLIASIYGATVLLGVVSDSDTVTAGSQTVNAGKVNSELSKHLTGEQANMLHKYQRPFAIFLACVAAAEFLMLLASLVLCFQRPEVYLPTYYARHASPPQPGNQQVACQAWTCKSCQKRNTSPDHICVACFTQN